jgi:hypothetical protein
MSPSDLTSKPIGQSATPPENRRREDSVLPVVDLARLDDVRVALDARNGTPIARAQLPMDLCVRERRLR